MNTILSPLSRQIIVSTSCQLSAISAGGIYGYPAVLLHQLGSNSSSIPLDLHSSSWLASLQGFAGVASVFIPSLMQWRGRRFAFVFTNFIVLLGWIITYFAQDVTGLLVGGTFYGFGGNSIIVVSLNAVGEMVDPKTRNISMILFSFMQLVGMVLVTISGYFISWRNVCIVLAVPLILAILSVILWLESPSWLACKGEFIKCEESFTLLRGTGKEATNELRELIKAQKESIRLLSIQKSVKKSVLRELWITIMRRDFYIPNIYNVLIFVTFYWSGVIVIFVYAVNVIETTTNSTDFISFVYISIVFMIGGILSIILTKYLKNKCILILTTAGCVIGLLLSSIVIYCKDFNVFPKESLLFCVLLILFSCASGQNNQTFAITSELLPVKHRGLGGALSLIYASLLHAISVKVSPYLFVEMGMAGTFLLFAAVTSIGLVLIWIYVPETKGKTLQEIENHYNLGRTGVQRDIDDSDANMPLKDNNVNLNV